MSNGIVSTATSSRDGCCLSGSFVQQRTVANKPSFSTVSLTISPIAPYNSQLVPVSTPSTTCVHDFPASTCPVKPTFVFIQKNIGLNGEHLACLLYYTNTTRSTALFATTSLEYYLFRQLSLAAGLKQRCLLEATCFRQL